MLSAEAGGADAERVFCPGDRIGTEQMLVRAPSMQWPESFDALGPSEDPAIVLVGEAQIEGVDFVITAIRMRKGMRMPDYREGIPVSTYESALDNLREEIEMLSSSSEPSLVPLQGGQYLLWMLPAGEH